MEVEREDEGGAERGAGGESRRNQVDQRIRKSLSGFLLLRTQGPPNTRKQPVK